MGPRGLEIVDLSGYQEQFKRKMKTIYDEATGLPTKIVNDMNHPNCQIYDTDLCFRWVEREERRNFEKFKRGEMDWFKYDLIVRTRPCIKKINWYAKLKSSIFCTSFIEKTLYFAMI